MKGNIAVWYINPVHNATIDSFNRASATEFSKSGTNINGGFEVV